jgi:glutaredoxin
LKLNMYIVYSKDNCPQCFQLESLLKAKKIQFEVKKLDKDYSRDELENYFSISGIPMPRSFPILFKDVNFLATFNDARAMIAKGDL